MRDAGCAMDAMKTMDAMRDSRYAIRDVRFPRAMLTRLRKASADNAAFSSSLLFIADHLLEVNRKS